MKKLIFLPVFLLLAFSSCKKNDVAPDTTGVTDEMARDSLFYIMKSWYYWYNGPEANSITTTTKNNYADPYALLEAMRYKELDRWSFVADYDEFNAEMQGTFVGHGFRVGLDDAGNARIAMIYDNSSLYLNGVRRGWIIKKVNGVDLAPILIAGDATAYSNLIGPGEAGITNTFIFTKPDGTDVTILATKSSFTVHTVLLCDTLHLTSGVTGHLVFESFIEPSAQELNDAFTYLKNNGVTDLILDLRYNTGGYLYIAQGLASWIAGSSYQGSVFAKLSYNDKHIDENTSYPFVAFTNGLDLSRVVVITSRSTASASEAVINGLKPYLNVVTIGDTTNGKPTGMNGWSVGKKFWMWPITFKIVNEEDQGDYFAGIFPDKQESDDITHDFSDRHELCLNDAIYYLEHGSVSARSLRQFKRYPQFSERPEWMKNTFIKER
jgi:carboxyl-terminal processing protease